MATAHAQALSRHNPIGLEAVARRWRDERRWLHAAEAYAQAARAHQRRGAVADAQRTHALAVDLLARSGAAFNPSVAAAPADPLTPTERAVATLAAAQLTSAQIGERLHISTRTVDSHLGRVYAKLGVSGRSALRHVLAP